MQECKTVAELVREMEALDKNGVTTSSKYVTDSMRENIDRTEAYINSKHTSGDKDYMGRDKPFFNIVSAARNIWYRATDIDRKNIVVRATREKDEIAAFIGTILLQEWMKKVNFGKFLNDWGLSLSTHGSSIVKFIEKDGELCAKVMDWNDMIVDAVDFEHNIKIERFYLTPAQLKQRKEYDQEMVDKLLDATVTRKTLTGQQKDTKNDYIEVFEVHGELSMAQYKLSKGEEPDEEDDNEYFQQIHVLSFQATSGKDYTDYTLYSGKESKDPYMLTHLIKKDGITYAGGAVMNLFEAQWMVNHTQKMIKDQLDLASKIIFQTSDGAFSGSNVLTNIENGEILTHKGNEPLTMLNNKPDIGAMQSFKSDWQNIANQIDGISEAMQGQNPPSGTAWKLQQALLQESHSLFELMTENKGLYLIDMLTEYVIPFFKKQLDNSDEISAILEDHQIKEFDARYVPNEIIRRLNKKKIDTVLSGEIYNPEQEGTDLASIESEVKKDLVGNQRFIKTSEISDKTWKEIFRNLEWKLDIDITGEAKDTQAVLGTLTTIFQSLMANPAVLQDENVRMVFNKILSLSNGVSPLELSLNKPAPSSPQMGQVGGGAPVMNQMPNQPNA